MEEGKLESSNVVNMCRFKWMLHDNFFYFKQSLGHIYTKIIPYLCDFTSNLTGHKFYLTIPHGIHSGLGAFVGYPLWADDLYKAMLLKLWSKGAKQQHLKFVRYIYILMLHSGETKGILKPFSLSPLWNLFSKLSGWLRGKSDKDSSVSIPPTSQPCVHLTAAKQLASKASQLSPFSWRTALSCHSHSSQKVIF